MAGDAGRRFEPRALSGTDHWGVLPDGSLWVARVYENRVDWRGPDGTWVEGDPLPDRVLEVTQYDRELFYRKFPPELRATAEQLPFAAVKPPFEAGFTSPAGTVWLEKSRAPADSSRRYHEVDRAGHLVREIRVPGTGRIVAVGAEQALVAERVTRWHPLHRIPHPGREYPLDLRRSSMKSVLSLCAVALLGLAGCTKAESQSGLTLEAKLPGGFGQLSNVVELDSGRVVFADTRDKLFLSAAFGSGKLDTLGKRVEAIKADAAPGEYKFPGWVARLAGDTVALVDFSALRTTLWNEQGQPLRVLAIAQVAGTAPVLVYDTMGHGYKIDYKTMLDPEPGQTTRPDSVPVLRIELGGGKVDTVARLAAPEFGEAMFGEQKQQAAKVFAPNDFFGVLANGTAWVARGRDNRVDWRAPDGSWTPGQEPEVHRAAGHPGRQGSGSRAGARAGQAVRHAAGSSDPVPVRRDQAAVRLRAGPPER